MDTALIALGLYLLLKGGNKSAPQQQHPQQRPRPGLPPQEQWSRAIAAASPGTTPVIAAGLARAAIKQGLGPPDSANVALVLGYWARSREMAEQHRTSSAKWTDQDLLWYATMSQLRPELLTGSGERAPTLVRQILSDHPGDNDVRTAVDTAMWVATGQHLPPPAPAKHS